MIKKNNRDKTDVRIMISGLIILTVCLLACILHIADLYSSYKKRVNDEFKEQTELAQTTLSDLVMATTEGLNEMEQKLSDPGINEPGEIASAVLAETGDDFSFVELLFMGPENTIYNAAGVWDTNQFRTIQDTIAIYRRAYIQLSDTVLDENGNNTLMYMIPVTRDEEIIGHLLAFQSFADVLEQNEYHYLNEKGYCYLINKQGLLLEGHNGDPGLFAEQKDFFSALLAYSNGTARAQTIINNLKKSMQDDQWINLSFQNYEGRETYLLGTLITGTEDIYFVCGYVEDEMIESVRPTIFRSVVTCSIIILLMISLIIYVWASAKNANIVIEKLAYEDNVTSGKNANYFRDRALQIMAQNRETPFIVQRFDIVNFRYINEAYGHNRADEILTSCITLANQYFDEKELCVRMDSDQFLTLNINDSRVDQKRADYMEAVNQHARSIGVKYPVRLKFGVYQIRKQDGDIELIIDRANVARKSLDGKEKKLIAYYSDALVQNMRKVDKIESEMEKALETGEFKVFLQPKWDIINNRLAGAEALARWIKADGNIVYPGNFIPVFEKNGFIEKLDFFMLESVCREMGGRIKRNQKICPVSVNQSRLLLHNPEYINNVVKVLKAYDMPRQFVELELTETVFFDDRTKMIDIMKQLKDLHLKLSMDDFGSGYSSLNLLKDIPFDVLKIDREFFSEAITSESSTWILQKIIEMAEGLGMEVICEGVETQVQIDSLRKIGCHMVQGYYYSKPMPMDEFVAKYLP